jgi:YidC/Oxa1 family membrane protein insertase
MNAIYNALYKYITPIFGYIMLFFYGIVDGFNGSYGIAIILFTIFARLVTLPSTISQQKGMAKQQRLAPKIRRIQEKYAGNQQKIQEETQNLYAREGYNPMSAGCLPLLIQFPFIIGLFGVLYNPIRYAIGLDSSTSQQFVNVFSQMVSDGVITVGTKVDRYYPLYIIQHFDEVKAYIASKGITDISAEAIAKIQSFIDAKRFTFLGLELGVQPSFKVRDRYWLIPILSGLTSLISAIIMQLQQKKTNPAANAPGAGCTMLMMPLISLWFAFLFPSGIGVYWIVSNVISTIQSLILKKTISPQKNIAKLMVKETVERRSRENSIKRIKNN